MRKTFVFAACVLGLGLTGCANGFTNTVAPKSSNYDETPNGAFDPVENSMGNPRGNTAMPQLEMTAFETHTPRSQGFDMHPEVFTHGDVSYLYFASDRDGSGYNIYRKTPMGTSLATLTSTKGDEFWPRVSPCGRYLAFGSNVNGNWDIFVMALNDLAMPPMLITVGSSADDIQPAWSPDGKTLAYASMSETVGCYILKSVTFGDAPKDMAKPMPRDSTAPMNASYHAGNAGPMLATFAELPSSGTTGSGPMTMSAGPLMVMSRNVLRTNQGELVTGIHPDFRPSADTNQIVYQDFRKAGKGFNGLRTLDLNTGVVTLLPIAENHGAIQPRWSPDGMKIVYTTVDKQAQSEAICLCGGDGFAVVTPDGAMVADIRNPTGTGRIADPVWRRYMGVQRIFFSANDQNHEQICSVKVGR